MPGLLYPPHCVRPTESRAEEHVHELLKTHLPEGWIAWHSFRFGCRTRDGANLREIDFLLRVPGKGLIAIEVKGGTGWTIEDGCMRRYPGSPEPEDPLGQVISAKNDLRHELGRRLGTRYLPWIEHMVFFPDVPGYDPPSGNGYERVTLTSGHLAYLSDELQAFAARNFQAVGPGDGRAPELLHEMWCERWVPSLRASEMRKARSKELFELSSAQRGLARRLAVRGSLLIAGVPGSGKTIIARELAFRWAEER